MNTELLKILLNWAKAELAEKLAPKSKEKTVEQLALAKIRAILAAYAPRYGETVPVQEIFDEISAVINEVGADTDAPLTRREPFQANPITADYISKFTTPATGKKWVWPGISAASDLWYTPLPPAPELTKYFDRIDYFSKGQRGDVVVFDNRIGNGFGATGILVEDCGSTVRVYVDDITSLQYRIIGKAAVLGYFRPKTTKKA